MFSFVGYDSRVLNMVDNNVPIDPPLHTPVMVTEILNLLQPQPGDSTLDLTTGTGGHALHIGRKLGKNGFMALLDRDRQTLEMAKRRLHQELDCEMRFFHGRFSRAAKLVKEIGAEGFNLILADLGIGTHQLDDLSRGFSYTSTGRLDMRFDNSSGQTAWDVVNHAPEKELADIFYQLGEERYSRQIAAEIIRCREKHSIDSPAELTEIAKKVYARKQSGRTWQKHPATRIFQALRIYVNQELDELDRMLKLIPDLLLPGGRLGVITYHSLEARSVKQTWKKQEKANILEILTPTPLFPSEKEIERNPRARSAQFRVAQKKETDRKKDNIEN